MFGREDFDRQFNRTRKTINILFWVQVVIVVLVTACIVYTLYAVGIRLLPLIEDVLRSMAA